MSAEPEKAKITTLAEQINEQKPFEYIIQNLENTFGVPKVPKKSDALTMIIRIILSQATSDANSYRTFENLKKHFQTWEKVLRSDENTIVDVIRLGGLANQKAHVIKNLLQQLNDKYGSLSLKILEKMPDEEAKEFLLQFRGIGPKTVACTLLFACRKDVFPLDTHIFRIFKRMGVLPERVGDKKAHKLLDALVPTGKFYSLHINLIRLGRQTCRPREPLCEKCPLIEYCNFGASAL